MEAYEMGRAGVGLVIEELKTAIGLMTEWLEAQEQYRASTRLRVNEIAALRADIRLTAAEQAIRDFVERMK